MLKTWDLISRGYFPRELPPAFTTQLYGELIKKNNASLPKEFDLNSKVKSKPVIHNLARPGSLRRKLSIPNPLNYYQVASILEQNFARIENNLLKTNFSLSRPQIKEDSERAIDRLKWLNDLPEYRAKIQATSRYILKTDISTFYPSIYTHSIPWLFT